MVFWKKEKKEEVKRTAEEQLQSYQQKRKQARNKGLVIMIFAVIFGIALIAMSTSNVFSLIGATAAAILIVVFFVFLVLYFIWAKHDILTCNVNEGYCKVIVVGDKFKRIVFNHKGKAMNKDWEIVEENSPNAYYKDKSTLGMHTIWPLFFGKVYTHILAWRKYDFLKKAPIDRRELLTQTSLMDYPYYIETLQAEDKDRAPLDLFTVVTMRIVNPYKALFKITTEWIEVATPKIQGTYVAYIKLHSFQEMLENVKSLGDSIFEEMKQSGGIFEELRDIYGVEIISIDVIEIIGGDKDMQAAIKANAVAKLRKDATITDAEAAAKKKVIDSEAEMQARANKTAGLFMTLISGRTGLSEDKIKECMTEHPQEFQKTYGPEIEACNKLVEQMVSAEANGLVQILTSGSTGSSGGGVNNDLIATVVGMLKAMNTPAVSGNSLNKSGGKSQAQSEPTKQNPSEEKKLTKEEKRKKFLKDNGLEEY
ncbi:MAG: SPFH domain-containing protein [Candidatus Paceibacterota bacterium]